MFLQKSFQIIFMKQGGPQVQAGPAPVPRHQLRPGGSQRGKRTAAANQERVERSGKS